MKLKYKIYLFLWMASTIIGFAFKAFTKGIGILSITLDWIDNKIYSLISLITALRFRFILLNLVLSPNFENSLVYSLLNRLKNAFSESIDKSSPTILIFIISLYESLLSLILRLFLILIVIISLYISSTIVKIILNKSVKFFTSWI